jgi:DNA-binding PadR family transcriptional regulator
MAKIGQFQQALLTALRASHGEATTHDIYEMLSGTYAPISKSSIFVALDRMIRHGLVASKKGEPLPQRGGKARLYYTITEQGRHVLLDIEQTNASLRFVLKPVVAGMADIDDD